MKAKTWLREVMRKDGTLTVSAADMGYAQSLKGVGMLTQRVSVKDRVRTPAPEFFLTGKGSLWLSGLSKLLP